MTKRRTYTVFFLVGLFMFPLIFQPWHIVQHHGHDHESPGHVHETDQSYVHAHHHDTNCSHGSAQPISIYTQDHSHDPCYICDYKFPVKDLPTLYEPGFIAYQFKELQSVNLVLSDLQQVYSLINPRAPPCFSPELS